MKYQIDSTSSYDFQAETEAEAQAIVAAEQAKGNGTTVWVNGSYAGDNRKNCFTGTWHNNIEW